jgi:hypothetical protein
VDQQTACAVSEPPACTKCDALLAVWGDTVSKAVTLKSAALPGSLYPEADSIRRPIKLARFQTTMVKPQADQIADESVAYAADVAVQHSKGVGPIISWPGAR